MCQVFMKNRRILNNLLYQTLTTKCSINFILFKLKHAFPLCEERAARGPSRN